MATCGEGVVSGRKHGVSGGQRAYYSLCLNLSLTCCVTRTCHFTSLCLGFLMHEESNQIKWDSKAGKCFEILDPPVLLDVECYSHVFILSHEIISLNPKSLDYA